MLTNEKEMQLIDRDAVQQLLDKIAGDMVVVEFDNYPALAGIHDDLIVLKNMIESEHPNVMECIQCGADLIEKLILHEPTVNEQDVQTFLAAAITALQSVFRDGKKMSEIQLPQFNDGQDPKRQSNNNKPAESSTSKTYCNDDVDQDELSSDDCTLQLDEADTGLIGEFITEAREHCSIAEQMLMNIESGELDDSPIDAMFRSFHTIKGAAAILNVTPLAILAHESETLLDLARRNEIEIADKTADIVFESIDKIGQLLTVTEQCLLEGQPFDASDVITDIIRRLRAICKNPQGLTESDSSDRVGDLLVDMGAASKDAIESALSKNPDHLSKTGENLVKSGVVPAKSVANALRLQKKIRNRQSDSGARALKEMVKIDTARLDSLVDTIGELVIAESMVGQFQDFLEIIPPRIAKNVAHLNKITRELQAMGMAMRLVPVRPTFQKLSRAIRDLNRTVGKKTELIISGEETEVDRGIVESIGDPLMHMVRNSADHAIEEPAERRKAGKPETGRIWLRAFHKGGNIYFEIEDDGRGLDKDRILEKARERNLWDGRKELSDREIYELILQPGFSTAKKVTDVSGRGVGMDVVKKNIDSMRGNLEIHSEPGVGSRFTIRLPLTLAIIDGMLINVSGERYIIPTVSVVETVQLSPETIETIGGRNQIIHLRNRLYPLICLSELFDLERVSHGQKERVVIIVDDGTKTVGLVADELIGLSQTVIKNLGPLFSNAKWFSGGAILSDGNVGLIIDISGIIELAGSSPHASRSVGLTAIHDEARSDMSDLKDLTIEVSAAEATDNNLNQDELQKAIYIEKEA